MNESKVDRSIRDLHTTPRNPIMEDYATLLGFMDAQPETILFSNLNEIEKLILFHHLQNKLSTRMSENQRDFIYHKFAALYLPSIVGRFLEPPPLPSNSPAFMVDEFVLDNPYLGMMCAISHTPYFARYLRSDEAVAEGRKKLMPAIAERLVSLAPSWDRKMANPPPDREPGYYQGAAGDAIQLLSTLLVAFVKEPRRSSCLIKTVTETALKPWLRKWERLYSYDFLGTVSKRTLGQLEKRPTVMHEAKQMRRLLKNWDVCGKVGCDKTTNLKACSRCKTVRYCCTAHQKAHWSAGDFPHKEFCFQPVY